MPYTLIICLVDAPALPGLGLTVQCPGAVASLGPFTGPPHVPLVPDVALHRLRPRAREVDQLRQDRRQRDPAMAPVHPGKVHKVRRARALRDPGDAG